MLTLAGLPLCQSGDTFGTLLTVRTLYSIKCRLEANLEKLSAKFEVNPDAQVAVAKPMLRLQSCTPLCAP